jgi:predicted DsbA family dithiol-disulfide isomerase
VLTLHFDLTSPQAALAVLRLQEVADQGHAVVFRGIDVLGVDMALPVTLDQLAELAAVREAAAERGLSMRRPTLRPPTLDAHLLGLQADAAGLGAAWRTACLTAYWTRGEDLSDHTVLVELAGAVGLARDVVERHLADRAARDELRARMLQLRQLGIGGVPVLELDGTLCSADVDDATLLELARA